MLKGVLSGMAVAVLATAVNAGTITIQLTADPSANLANPVGSYDPGEVVSIHTCLFSKNGLPIPDVGLVQIDYSNMPTSLFPDGADAGTASDYEPDSSKVAAFLPLTVDPPNSPIFATVTNEIPSLFTIPAGPLCVNWNNFSVTVGAAGANQIIDVLGPTDPDDATGAYISTSTFDIIWDNGDFDPDNSIEQTFLKLTSVPEPASLALVILGAVAALRRRS